ncbi:cell cycle transcriptional repressor Whi5 [Schizosaccharomyces cryophilus OY26]|uniref:Cell cycle transcriptional repressor Whi5 n=1 Tax=Schizosaccharomyces cryophilus (strain OY26 / ATCC MYA-4695 / CBS 11777 / NBRC 106824 / NRRL Y48691) TaxID=653667 RepID=S9WXW5_SCHCR|nr:cell cycle transcriptional repressor Whi5 [Schizosaccharomyces cryophilus OY26]EPY49562.1 cell cycle transcriptional repressor Whi5 [Schizosaccharomyces cryophilus OY26]
MTMAKQKHSKTNSGNSLRKMSEKLKARLKYAVFKVDRGWENQTLDQVESLIRKRKNAHRRSRSINDLDTMNSKKAYPFGENPLKTRANSFSRLISPREEFLQLISNNFSSPFSSSSPTSVSSSLDRTSPPWLNSHDTLLEKSKVPFDLPCSSPTNMNGNLATICNSHIAFLHEGGHIGSMMNCSSPSELYKPKALSNCPSVHFSLSSEECKAAEAILSLVHAVPSGNISFESSEE